MTKNKTKKVLRIILPIATIISLFFVPWVLIKAWILPLPDTVQKQMDETIGYGFDGMIVYVNQAKSKPEFYAAGYKNREKKTPANPHSLFKIASIGKLYDAVSITKLVSNKQLSLDKTLADYFPEFKDRIPNADKITLRMMVQHRSGIFNVTETKDFWINPPKNNKEAISRILDLPSNFEPDTDYEYSNTNYMLISELIEKTTGKTKFQYIKEVILQPLGLKNTFGSLKEININNLMSGYYVGVEEDIKTTDYGSMIATAEDVGLFVKALNNGTLLTSNEQKIYASIYKFEHTGLIPGYQSIAKYDKDNDMVVIQFLNTTNFDGYNWTLGEIAYSRIVKIIKRRNPK
jgi:D-alanyl-D-alanine carboxypeptidase